MQIQTDGVIPLIPEELDRDCPPSHIGLAVDIGTTTIAVSAWQLATREHLATVAAKNIQMRYGYDVIRRISFATRPPLTGSAQVVESGPSALHYSIITQLEKLFAQALNLAGTKLPRGVSPVAASIVITGNTSMLSFVCAVPVKGIAAAPFSPASLFGFTATWNEVRFGKACVHSEDLDKPRLEVLQTFNASVINSEVPVYFPPCIGAFIGADTVCAMLSAGIPVPGSDDEPLPGEQPRSMPILLVDIGTNSEIVLYLPPSGTDNGRILCTSAAAGPAFEAANISCGMSSVNGAIDRITEEDGELRCSVIGNDKAKGICGSGLVSAAATFYTLQYIDKNGVLRKHVSKLGDGSPCIQLTPAVYISQQDIRNLQLAKSAVRTGLQYLMEKSPLMPSFYIAGGFGSHLSMLDAVTIGLIPPGLEKQCTQLGNAALAGASALLFSPTLRKKAAELARKAYHINLAAVPGFQQRFLSMIDF
ncbi:MAG: ASKHA domain-containing protein [Treponema sp.]|nr:ASKHA domain-containing protein [Treponema sp.]